MNDVPRAPEAEAAIDYRVTGRRIVAALIDIALLSVLFGAMAAAWGDFGENEDGTFEVQLQNGPFLVYIVLVLLYYVALEATVNATLGKLVMGLRVVKLDGSPPDLGAVLLRTVLRIVDALPVFYIVGLVAVAVTPKNQRLGDLAAGTTVARA